MKKIIALVLCVLVACTAFACLVSAENEGTTKDPYETDIPQVITNIAGGHSADHQKELGDGLKFFRILTENLLRFAKDAAAAFDRTVERIRNFNVRDFFTGLFSR
jgi:hypothetical protein